MKWSKKINNIFKKRYGGFDKYFDFHDFEKIWTNWNNEVDKEHPFILLDCNEAEIPSWLEDENISHVNCVLIENKKTKKYKKISLKEKNEIDLFIKKSQSAPIEDIICLDDCRCIILDKTNKKRPTFYFCLDKYNKKINKMLDIFREYVKSKVSAVKEQNVQWEKEDLEEQRQEKEQQEKEKHYKSLLNKGIYHLLDNDNRIFFEVCTRANGFLAGELITLAYTTNVPIHQIALTLHKELWDALGWNKKDVLYLTDNDKYFFKDIIKDLFEYEEENKCLNNIGLNVTNVKQIESIVLTKKPKIILVDSLQSLEGNSAANVRELKKLCRKYKILCILLFQMNNVHPKKVPDITRIGTRSGIVDQSDKIFIIWNVEQIVWYTTFYDYDKLNPEFDYDRWGELKTEEDGSKPKGHKERLYVISVDCVKNRRYKLFRDFIWYSPYDNSLDVIPAKKKKDIIIDFKERFGDGSYIGFDTRPIIDAINDLSSSVSSIDIPEFDGFVWKMN